MSDTRHPLERFRQPEPRPFTKEEQEERFELCHRAELAVRLALLEVRRTGWQLAEALAHFDDITGWHALGYESLSHWLADPEISLSRSTYYSLIDCWRTLHQPDSPTYGQSELALLDPSKVAITLPAIKSGKRSLGVALEDARSLTAADLRVRYRGGCPNVGEPPPEDPANERWFRCANCGTAQPLSAYEDVEPPPGIEPEQAPTPEHSSETGAGKTNDHNP